MVARANRVLRYDPDEASRNRAAAWAVGENCAQAADPVSARLVAHWSAGCGDPHLGQCHRAADEMVGAPQPFCRGRAGNYRDWRSARYDLLHRLQLERSRSRQVRQRLYQKRVACRNQNSRWKSVFADWRSRPLDQRRGGGLRRQDYNNQRKANRARWIRAASSRRNSEIMIVPTNMLMDALTGELAASAA